jgi:hypothetical protein
MQNRSRLVLAFLVAILLLSVPAYSQKKRKPRGDFNITASRISRDIVGSAIADSRVGEWRFEPNEWRQFRILQKSISGRMGYITVYVTTADANSRLEGRIRMMYIRSGKGWNYFGLENIDASIVSGISDASSIATSRTPSNVPIFSGGVAIAAGHFQMYKFVVPASGGRVVGWFRASGGRNDIRCWIINEWEFENFRNRNAFRHYYDSNWVTVQQLNVYLASGSYLLIFDNIPAVLTSKAVNGQINLEY